MFRHLNFAATNQINMNKTLRQVLWLSHALMLLTSFHHIYGAVVFRTPWRYHAVLVAVPVIVVTAVLGYRTLKKNNFRYSIFFWMNWAIILLFSIAAIGVFEGVYNHFLKDVLYFTGAGSRLLSTLFPPHLYEMPNDLIFEITGLAQAGIAVALIGKFYSLTKEVTTGRLSGTRSS